MRTLAAIAVCAGLAAIVVALGLGLDEPLEREARRALRGLRGGRR